MIEKLLKQGPKTFYYGRVIDTAPADQKVHVKLTTGLCLWVNSDELSLSVGDPLVIAGIEGDKARFIVRKIGNFLPQTGTIITF